MKAEKKKGWRTHTCYNLVRLMLQESSHSERPCISQCCLHETSVIGRFIKVKNRFMCG